MNALLQMSRPSMLALADGLETGRITSFTSHTLRTYVSSQALKAIAAELRAMTEGGMASAHIAATLRLLAEERSTSQAIADRVELVWSGLEVVSGESRETSVVVQELFRRARRNVLIASYALDRGEKAKVLFGALAARMDEEPELAVTLCVNVPRKYAATTASSILIREFAETFRDDIWPGERLPDVYYDPRSLSTAPGPRACLHAKCIVVDVERSFITSANFTEAAHSRNIEAGTVIHDRALARGLRSQFDSLIEQGGLRRLPGV